MRNDKRNDYGVVKPAILDEQIEGKAWWVCGDLDDGGDYDPRHPEFDHLMFWGDDGSRVFAPRPERVRFTEDSGD